MATATVHGNGRVNLNVPNVSILVARREAEGLRDALNAALPERIEDLVLDPRIKDLHVLQAAQAIAAEHECHGVVKQIANMIELYCGDTADETFVPGHVMSDLTAPRVRWVSDSWETGRNATLATNERRLSPAMVARTYTVEAYVLDRNTLPEHRHTKQFSHYTDAERAADTWTRSGEWNASEASPERDERDAPPEVVDEREVVVAVGDRVLDTMNGHQWRTVTRIEGDQVYMADGGVMGMRECMSSEIRLPSEKLD